MRARLGTWYSRIASRIVPEAEFRLPKPRGRTLHFTFDDGPNESTPELLDLLDEFAVPATFFLLGEAARRNPEHTAEIVRRGHAVGNHSMTHVDAWKVDRAVVEAEFDGATSCLEDLTGRPVTAIRPPFGRLNKAVVGWVRRHGRRLLMWDLMPPDFEVTIPAANVSRVLVRGARRGSIVVLHENEKSQGRTLPALRSALPILRDAGWRFVPLPDVADVDSRVNSSAQAGVRAA